MNNRLTGNMGEKKAMKYLVNHGYTIVDLNYYARYGEIDIVARKQGVYIFVEVKTRSTTSFGRPAEAVSLRKQRNMTLAAQHYIQKNKIDDFPVQFDVIEVLNGEGNSSINHIKNAFEAVNV